MSGIDCILDTNALIYLLDGRPCVKPYLSRYIGVSVISELELLSFHDITDDDVERIKDMLCDCAIVPLNEDVKRLTCALRRKYKVHLPDAIVAAASAVPLITADKGFRRIAEIDTILITP